MGLEIERKWKVNANLPAPLGPGVALRQGYLTRGGGASVRLRDKGGALLLTVKQGTGLTRAEVEVAVTAAQFDALWPLTAGARVEKTRHKVILGEHTAELDRFSGALAGLCLVEVEFDTEAAARAFTPPAWFGPELTHASGWTNAELALHGLPDGLHPGAPHA